MNSKEGIAALFHFAVEGILVVNERGEIIHINPSAEKLFGYGEHELSGKKIETLVPKRLAGRHEEHRAKYNPNPHARVMGQGLELFGLRMNGSEFPVEISLSPYTNAEGKFVIAFIVDITLRKQAEERLRTYSATLEKQVMDRTLILEEAIEELEKTKKDLNAALEKEMELSDLKSRFVSIASHEFRTPLTTILSSLSLVKKYGELNEKEKQDKHIKRIKSSINDLTDILNDFLSVSKLEEGKTECIAQELNVKEFISEIITIMQPLSKKQQKIIFNHKGNEIVYLDKKLLKIFCSILFPMQLNIHQKESRLKLPRNILREK